MKIHFVQTVMLSLMLATGSLAATAHAADRAVVHAVADKVNLNTADAVTIDRVLLNVGPSKAEAIVAYRKEHGSFKSPEQLALVKGIGLKTVEKNRDRILIGGSAVPARTPTAVARR
jgi:competence protein ComEA